MISDHLSHDFIGNKSRLPITYVYCIRDDYSNTAKIGFSKNPSVRLKQLQTASATTLRLVWSVSQGQSFERFIHKSLSERHVRGEWYDDTDDFLSNIYGVLEHELT